MDYIVEDVGLDGDVYCFWFGIIGSRCRGVGELKFLLGCPFCLVEAGYLEGVGAG